MVDIVWGSLTFLLIITYEEKFFINNNKIRNLGCLTNLKHTEWDLTYFLLIVWICIYNCVKFFKLCQISFEICDYVSDFSLNFLCFCQIWYLYAIFLDSLSAYIMLVQITDTCTLHYTWDFLLHHLPVHIFSFHLWIQGILMLALQTNLK